uniref:Uncharacterized protein n=1 Tax=Panagrolaimus sp. ES5 TaxID=591445 RepID=A0AC34F6S0_9BILA
MYSRLVLYFLLLSIFGIQNVFMAPGAGAIPAPGPKQPPPPRKGSKLEAGCYEFVGVVQCEAYQPILPSAKVFLEEYDEFSSNDEIAVGKVNPDGSYKIKGCADDFIFGAKTKYIELILRFREVCEAGDSYYNYYPHPDWKQTWMLKSSNNDLVEEIANPSPVIHSQNNAFGASLDQEEKSDVNPKFQHLSKSLPNPSASSSDGTNESSENRDSSASARSNVVKNVRPMHRRNNPRE